SPRSPWLDLPEIFRKDVEEYLLWCEVPDPLDPAARARALAPATLRLRHDHIHRAASAVCGAGFDASRLTSLARLVEPETVRALLRYQWEVDGCKFTAYCRDVAATLIVIASEWVKVPNEQLAELKKLRAKLGSERPGLTEKNSTLLRKFEDPHLVG